MRLGVFGGAFDPVHYGHLLLAECCLEQARLDAVWFMPTFLPPHKRDRALSRPEDRLTMLELAIGGHERFAISRLEIDRGGMSYTVDTLAELRAREPTWEILLAIGADALADLPTWRSPEKILELAGLAVVARPGAPDPDWNSLIRHGLTKSRDSSRFCRVDMPQVDFRSRELRARVAAGRSIRYRTPRAVEKFIETRGLYRESAASNG